MPITPTEKIWMNGELVPWDDAQIHVLTHTLHYGTGVFEGIRAYETERGPAVFRLTEHIERLFDSARDHDDGDPVHGRRARAGDEGHRARDRAAVVLHPADRVLRLRRDGPQHAAVRGRRRDRVLAVGRVPRRRRGHQGRAHEDLVVDAPRPQHDAAAVEDDRQLRELVAREGRGAEGRLRRGDHAQPRRARVGVHRREHLRGAARRADHAAASPRARCRASRRTRSRRSRATTASRCASTTSRAATSTSPRRCSCAAPRPR